MTALLRLTLLCFTAVLLFGCPKSSTTPNPDLYSEFHFGIFHFDKEKDYPIRLVQDTTCLPFIKHDQKQEYRFGFEIVTDGDVTFTYKTPRPFSLPDKDTGELKMVGSIRRGRAHHRHGRAYHVNIFTQYATLEKYEGKWKLLVFVDDKLARAVDFEVVAPQETP